MLRRRLAPAQAHRLVERYRARWPRPPQPQPAQLTIPPELAAALAPWCDEGEPVERFALSMLAQVAEFGPPRALAMMLEEAVGDG